MLYHLLVSFAAKMCFVEEWINPSDSLQLLGWPCQNIRKPIWHPFSQAMITFFLPDQIPWQHPQQFVHLKGCCHGICWFTPLDIDISSHHSKTSTSQQWLQWRVQVGARKVVDMDQTWKIHENYGEQRGPNSSNIQSYLYGN